jgi:hypothetical protein
LFQGGKNNHTTNFLFLDFSTDLEVSDLDYLGFDVAFVTSKSIPSNMGMINFYAHK